MAQGCALWTRHAASLLFFNFVCPSDACAAGEGGRRRGHRPLAGRPPARPSAPAPARARGRAARNETRAAADDDRRGPGWAAGSGTSEDEQQKQKERRPRPASGRPPAVGREAARAPPPLTVWLTAACTPTGVAVPTTPGPLPPPLRLPTTPRRARRSASITASRRSSTRAARPSRARPSRHGRYEEARLPGGAACAHGSAAATVTVTDDVHPTTACATEGKADQRPPTPAASRC